ncbi:uncharacterized protein LOC133217163 [Neopsephotus bourkii]|uniref:uncharacterized protein LOC133217163 n=1 Tax=Neopsephotus bourkii TaxID=309878 RepID=UPI002AA4FB23|nr:uncharacterized protein LOC133217163 [Neopsephotus bourkii]
MSLITTVWFHSVGFLFNYALECQYTPCESRLLYHVFDLAFVTENESSATGEPQTNTSEPVTHFPFRRLLGGSWNPEVCNEWTETNAQRNPWVCSTCAAAAASGACLLPASLLLPPAAGCPALAEPWLLGNAGNVESGTGSPGRQGSQLAERDSLRDGKTRDRSTQASPGCSRSPLPPLAGVRLLRLALLPPSSEQMRCQLNVMCMPRAAPRTRSLHGSSSENEQALPQLPPSEGGEAGKVSPPLPSSRFSAGPSFPCVEAEDVKPPPSQA